MTYDPDRFDAADATFEGRAFPSESEWLGLEPPADLPISPDFVARTVADVLAPTPAQLAAFAAPTPNPDFVSSTLAAILVERRGRWRELLARYVAPEPSREFVSRTLRALAGQGGGEPPAGAVVPDALHRSSASLHRRNSATRAGSTTVRAWIAPLLAAAAVLAVALFVLPRERSKTLEVRADETVPAAFGVSHAASPLPALLVALDHEDDPRALPNVGGDGVWLLLQRGGR
ncbi:MAG: hypothetical protein KDE27_29540 [Planctomycetes bacterium]|nr:hypothetical protein [Planctomycetota bacterium]